MHFDVLFLQVIPACEGCLIKALGLLLLAFLLGLLLGWIIWGRYRKMAMEAQKERDDYHARFTDMEKNYASLKYKYDELEKDSSGYKSTINKLEADNATLNAQMMRLRRELEGDDDGGSGDGGSGVLSSGVLDIASSFAPDDLQIIEGIGPKIEKILKNANIGTWVALSQSNADALKAILDNEGPNYRIHKPDSWPKQAQFAVDGAWDKLIAFQKDLDGGRDDAGDGDTPSKFEKLMLKRLGFDKKKTDLKIVEGIGPKIEQALKDAGINNWSELAAATADQIREILSNAEGKFGYAVPDTWPQQAQLAANSNWVELKALQDELDGGRA
jgi:predicted flap endonuclease-1-like 5' DNA nuclease/cell division protein FtsB